MVETMNIMELTEKDKALILALIDFVKDQPVGLEAIMGYPGVDDDTVWEDISSLEEKL